MKGRRKPTNSEKKETMHSKKEISKKHLIFIQEPLICGLMTTSCSVTGPSATWNLENQEMLWKIVKNAFI